MPTPFVQLSVKVDPETRDKLSEKAASAGKNLSDYVRSKLREDVSEESDLAKMRVRLAGIERKLATTESEVLELRRDYAITVEALMLLIGGHATLAEDEIRPWVDKHLRQKGR